MWFSQLRTTVPSGIKFYLGLKSGSSKTLGATYVNPWNTMFTLSLRLPWHGESTGVNLVKFVSNCETSSSEVKEGSNGGFNFRLITSDLQDYNLKQNYHNENIHDIPLVIRNEDCHKQNILRAILRVIITSRCVWNSHVFWWARRLRLHFPGAATSEKYW